MFERLAPPTRVIDEGAVRVLPAAVARRVDEIWRAAATNEALFDGRLFDVRTASAAALHGSFVPYRWWFAQRAAPELSDAIGIRALAVTGYVRVAEGVVLGRRARHVAEEAGLWELAPSGGVSPEACTGDGEVSVVAQFCAELREELGVPAQAIERMACEAMIGDPVGHTYEVVVAARLSITAAQLREHLTEASDEYESVQVVGERDVVASVATLGGRLAPMSRFILEQARPVA